MSTANAQDLRRGILASIPENLFDVHVEPRNIYIPESHIKALDPNRALVVGGRGTGKTFWWETLSSDVGAALLSRFFDPRREALQYKVSVGHGAKALAAGRALDADTLTALFNQFPERAVWKAVVLDRVASTHFDTLGTWSERVRWVHEHPEEAARILAETDDRLDREKSRHLVVFDAIDRTGTLWRDVVRAHRGLFSLLLELSGMRAIRAKAFVRLDVLQDPEVLRFPDASKLQTAAVELAWHRVDLYGLLWQYLANSDMHADVFRSLSEGWKNPVNGVWEVPTALRSKEETQQRLWHQIAGRWMGTRERQGDTYPWLTNHLGDAFGRASPRSFLTAVREAARVTPDDEGLAIHYKAIQEGVRGAAEIRAREIREDFPWTEQALVKLEGLLVPCDPKQVLAVWRRAQLDQILDRDEEARRRRRHGGDLRGVLDDLIDLGVVQRLRNGRINVPDVYRLGFGMKRKGGVAPRRS
ncbi:hypothetical protein [Sorangium cellulosum]|uniref:hypothetical protein n=1 Tax=Sorangium cellulosum TaxID=56 RepID=UPI0004115F23|nr:hypothetical protein [Sorangium cellulosum]